MVDRIQLLEDVYMPIESQWAVIAAGAVLDVPNKRTFTARHFRELSPGEAAGTLKNALHSVPIRGVRIK